MPYNNEICKLVIENIALLEEADSVIEEIQKTIFKEINNKFKDHFENNASWEGVYKYWEDDDEDETTITLKKWPKDDEANYIAYFTFEITPDADKKCNYHLTALLGGRNSKGYAINFYVDEKNLCDMNNKAWKEYLRKQYLEKPVLQNNGVQIEGKCLSIPIRLDLKKVAAEYPDDFDQCLKPIDDAIKILEDVSPVIDEIVQEALKQNNSGE